MHAGLRRRVRALLDGSDPVFWAIAIGALLTQFRDPVRDDGWLSFAVVVASVAAVKLAEASRSAGLAVAVVTELLACAAGYGPSIAIGFVVVCACNFLDTRLADAPYRRPRLARAAILGVLAAVVVIPWVFEFRAGPIFAGPARAGGRMVEAFLLLVFAVAVRANWNLLDSLLRGASKRAEEAELARDTAAAAERARIARELHDVVAHQMAVVVAQAQGAEAVALREPGRAREALDTIARTTREALVEMRRLVAIDRPGDVVVEPATPGPMPGLAVEDLSRLADNAEAAGLDVRMTIEMKRGTTVPPGVALAAHRAVQEALTNAAKHAPGSTVEVRINQGEGELTITVTNGPGASRPMDLPGSGVGLVGMRERTDFYGGTLEAGPTPGGGWSVVARFPTLEAPPTSE